METEECATGKDGMLGGYVVADDVTSWTGEVVGTCVYSLEGEGVSWTYGTETWVDSVPAEWVPVGVDLPGQESTAHCINS